MPKQLAIYYRDPKTRSFTRISDVLLTLYDDKPYRIESTAYDTPQRVREQLANAAQMTIYFPSYWRKR